MTQVRPRFMGNILDAARAGEIPIPRGLRFDELQGLGDFHLLRRPAKTRHVQPLHTLPIVVCDIHDPARPFPGFKRNEFVVHHQESLRGHG